MVREKTNDIPGSPSNMLFRIPTGGHAGVGKVFMQLRGLDLGPPRLPVLPLSPDQSQALETSLRDIGFFDWT